VSELEHDAERATSSSAIGPRPERPSEGLPGEGIGPLGQTRSSADSGNAASASPDAAVEPRPPLPDPPDPGLPDKGKGPLDA
jgi:hypothetical protein